MVPLGGGRHKATAFIDYFLATGVWHMTFNFSQQLSEVHILILIFTDEESEAESWSYLCSGDS